MDDRRHGVGRFAANGRRVTCGTSAVAMRIEIEWKS